MNIQLYNFRNTLRTFKTIKKDIPISWVEVFIEVAIKEGQSIQEIANKLEKPEGSTAHIIDYLERFRLVNKRKDPKEWRVRRIHLSQSGKYLVQSLNINMM